VTLGVAECPGGTGRQRWEHKIGFCLICAGWVTCRIILGYRLAQCQMSNTSAIAERLRCRVGQFWVGGRWWRGSDNTLHQTWTMTENCMINPLLYEKQSTAFLSLCSGGLGATQTVHLRLVVKLIVVFPVSDSRTFFGRCYGWGGTSEYRLEVATNHLCTGR